MQNRIIWDCLKNFRCLHSQSRKYLSKDNIPSLRPFYLKVHPDFLWQHPTKKEVNENSLKQLNQFIQNLQNNVPPASPPSLPFYIRTGENDDHPLVNIKLDNSSLINTINNILALCNLPTVSLKDPLQLTLPVGAKEESVSNKCFFYKKLPALNETTLKRRILKAQTVDLVTYLTQKRSKALGLLQGMQRTKKEVIKLTREMKECLRLEDIVWDNSLTCVQHKNCIRDLERLSKECQIEMEFLSGRILVFGDETGFYLNGDISFGCCDSRRLWVDVLQKIAGNNLLLQQIWEFEDHLMEQLRGTRVVHQTTRPSLDMEKYLYWLRKLSYVLEQTAASLDTRWSPTEELRIMLDCNSTEMRVQENGVMVLCPSLLASENLQFLNTHFEEAAKAFHMYKKKSLQEVDSQKECVLRNHIELFKENSLNQEYMVNCCERLVKEGLQLTELLKNLQVCITTSYSETEDGMLCIPWNWKISQLKL